MTPCTVKEASRLSIQGPKGLCPVCGVSADTVFIFWRGIERNEKGHNMPKLSTLWHPLSHKLWKVGSPHQGEYEMKGSLLFGLSGLRRAALPLPLGVFKPSERYWWPLSPSSSLRFACNVKVQPFVTGHAGDHKKWGCVGPGPARRCGLVPAPSASAWPPSGPCHALRPGAGSGAGLARKLSSPAMDYPVQAQMDTATGPPGGGSGATLLTPSLIRHMCQAWGETVRPQQASWNVNSLVPCDTWPPTFISDLGWTSFLVLPLNTLCLCVL